MTRAELPYQPKRVANMQSMADADWQYLASGIEAVVVTNTIPWERKGIMVWIHKDHSGV